MQNKIVDAALRALLYEVVLQPKPGLVDPVTRGAHSDMDIFTFIDSSISLREYFRALAEAGRSFVGEDYRDLFQEIRIKGIEAEKAMFEATAGVNTHKGAIFSLGVLVTAASCLEKQVPLDRLASETIEIAKAMLSGLTQKDFEKLTPEGAQTIGEKQFMAYGIKGIRGEAEAGFPTVINLSLPYLRNHQGRKEEKLLDTLMLISGNLKDSNLIKRAGNIEILDEIKIKVKEYFLSPDKVKFLKDLDSEFTQRGLSLGGSADLLILTIFFALLEGTLI